jgi:acyl-CoA dehydrogenase-like protein
LDFQLTSEQHRLRKKCRELAADFATRAAAHDRDATHPVENYQRLREEGFLALTVGKEWGGSGASFLDHTLAYEVLAQGCPSTALAFNMHASVVMPLLESAEVSTETKQRVADLVVRERKLIAGNFSVAAHRAGVVEHRGGQAGAHHVDVVEGRLGGDRLGLAGTAEVAVGNVEGEVFGHFVRVEHGPDFEPDFGRASQRLALADYRRGNARQRALCGGEQLLALAGTLAASARLRQTIRRSPGKSGEVIEAMSRWSNSEICNAHPRQVVSVHAASPTCYRVTRDRPNERSRKEGMRFGFFDQLPCALGYSEPQRFKDIVRQPGAARRRQGRSRWPVWQQFRRLYRSSHDSSLEGTGYELLVPPRARLPRQLAPEALDFTRLIRPGETVGWAEATAGPVFLTRLLDAQAARCAPFQVFFPLTFSNTLGAGHPQMTVTALGGRPQSPDSALEGNGFELVVPRHKSRGFPQHSGHCEVSAGS